MMRRREFITLIGGAAAWPLTAHAQQPVIGYLGMTSPEAYASRLLAFRQGLSETGYLEGRNVTIEYRWAESQVTGVTSLNVEINPKRLELLHELIPNVKTVALLVNPADRTVTEPVLPQMQAAARTLGLELHILQASAERDIEPVFARLAELGAGGLVVVSGPFFVSQGARLATLALRHRVPTLFYTREFADAGGLASYGGNLTESHRLSGQYVGRILKGEKPGDLPVQAPTKYELVINLKTAKALGLTVPPTLLARADEVIE